MSCVSQLRCCKSLPSAGISTGICKRDWIAAGGQWTLVAASPYPSGAGEYWTHLAASGGQMALAIEAKPVVDRAKTKGPDMKFTRNAPTSLRILKDGSFVPVRF